jgi:hypothetical protein
MRRHDTARAFLAAVLLVQAAALVRPGEAAGQEAPAGGADLARPDREAGQEVPANAVELAGLTAEGLARAARGLQDSASVNATAMKFTGDGGPDSNAFRLGWSWMGTAGPPAAGVVDEEFLASTSRSFVSALHSSDLRVRFAADFAALYAASKDGDVQRAAELLTSETMKKGTEFFSKNLPGEQAVAFAQGKLYMKAVLLYNQTGKLSVDKKDVDGLVSMFGMLGYQGPLLDSVRKLAKLVEGGDAGAVVQHILKDMSLL